MITTEKAQLLARASDASYYTSENPRSMPDMVNNGYTVVEAPWLNDPDTGFNVVVFQKVGTKEYIVAFTGTQGAQDGVADIALGTSQWKAKGQAVTDFLKRLEATNIDFTGQSLGGALAQYAAYDYLNATDGNPIKSEVLLASYDGLGGMAGLRQMYGTGFDPTLVLGLKDAAHFYTTSSGQQDLVTRLGDGHFGGDTYAITMSKQDANLMEIHCAWGDFFNVNMPMSPTSPDYLTIPDAQKIAAAIAFWGNDAKTINNEDYAKALVGVLTAIVVAPSWQVDQIVDAIFPKSKYLKNILPPELRLLCALQLTTEIWALNKIGNMISKINNAVLGQPRSNLDYYYSKLEYRLPDPTQSNTYRIVWIGGDPLVLDLDGDGLETAAANGYSGALFDHNNDGIKTATGWIKGDDGLLVRDINGDGIINNGAELFGDSTQLANGTMAANGFVALKDLDSNNDGKVDATDTAFSELKIWRDTNQDGISQADELYTLAETGIESLNTAAATTSISTSAGQQILTGSFTKTDGTTATLADLNFTQDSFHSEYVDHVEIPEALADLPNIQGMGRLRDLREAAALSPVLADVLGQYAVAETKTEQKTLLDQLLLEWAKTDPKYTDTPINPITDYAGMTSSASSDNIIYLRVGQSLPSSVGTTGATTPKVDPVLQNRTRILDALYGDRVTTGMNYVKDTQISTINKSYTALADAIYADLLIQTRFAKYLNSVELSITETSISLDTSKVTQLFQDRIASDPVNGLTDLIEFNKYAGDLLSGTAWDGPALLDENLRSQAITPELQAVYQEFNVMLNGANGTATGDIILGDDQKRTINGGEGNNVLLGGSADETMVSGSGNDTIRGGDGNDTIKAGLGDDAIDGGKGDDILYGTDGNSFYKLASDNDTYLFGLGDGHDTIYNRHYDAMNSDTIRFKEGVAGDSVRFERVSGYSEDLNIILGDGSDSITVKNWFSSPYYQIAGFEFSDGTILDTAYVNAHLSKTGTEGNDAVIGSWSGENVNAFGGSDTLMAGGGDDVLDGGAGDDIMAGGLGDDIYRFGRGSGHDVVSEAFGDNYSIDSANDSIELGEGVTPDDVIVRRFGTDMVLSIKGTDDQLTVKGTLDDRNESNCIEEVRFADGTIWDGSALRAGSLLSTDGDDRLEGGNADEVIDGGSGYDILIGREGSDTYSFGRGSGQDVITEEWGQGSNTDTVSFNSGISPADLEFSLVSEELMISIKGTPDTLRITHGAWDSTMIEKFSFADGTVLTWNNVITLAGVTPTSESMVGTSYDDILVGSDLDSTILGLDGEDLLTGGEGNDRLEGGGGSDVLIGNRGDDALFGGDGDDILDGGDGRDYLEGGTGANVYRFKEGGNLDFIHARLADGSDDTIEFDAGITPADLEVQLGNQIWNVQPGDSGYATLVVGTGEAAFRIEVDGWRTDIARSSIKRFLFSDGTVLSLDQIIALNDGGVFGDQSGTEGDDTLIGSNADDYIFASEGDDVIRARAGDDYVDGGDGNDRIFGGSGNDDLTGFHGNDILDGGKGDDFLHGGVDADILAGGKGADSLDGGSGEDVYLFNRGDGDDYIENSWSDVSKTLSFGVGIVPSDIKALVDEFGELTLLVDDGAGGSIRFPWFQADRITEVDLLPLRRVQFVEADGTVSVYDLEGLVSNRLGALSTSSSAAPISLFADASAYDVTLAALPAGGDEAVAYAQTGDLFGTPFYSVSPTPSDGDDRVVGTKREDILESGVGNDLLYGLGGNDYLDGGSGQDRIDGGAGNDTIYGGSGNDLIAGGDGDDVISAGSGNDIVYGGPGDDKFIFNAGDGLLTIERDYDGAGYMDDRELWFYEENGSNVLSFGAGIALSDLRFSEQGGYLVIDIPSSGDRVKLAGYNTDSPTFSDMVDNYEFADGSVATQQDILDAWIMLNGTGGDDELFGTVGNDTVEGGAGNDYFTTGQGNDRLIGGSGDDVYELNLGDGLDTVVDISDPGMENSVSLGYGITPDLIRPEVVDGNLILWAGDGGDGIRFEGFDPTIPEMPQPVKYLNFWDGSSMSLSELLASKAGAAYQEGGSGSNTYLFNQGDGVVSIFDISEGGAVNTLKFGPGIAPEDLLRHLRFESPHVSGSGNGTFVIAFENGDQVRMDGFTPEDVDNSPRSIDTFVFADGTILSFAEAVRSIFVVEGDANDNLLTGTNLSDRLYGYEGSDSLGSGAGNDVLTGGAGNDLLNGESGRDTYIFNLGAGADTVIDSAENGVGNIASFGPGITRDDLTFSQDGSTLTISYGDNGDAIVVENFDLSGVNGTQVIDTFEFSDGNVLSYRELTNRTPVAGEPLAALTATQDQPFVFQIPENAFSDADGDQLTYQVSVSGYDTPPEWLSFDPATRIFSGTPGNDHVGTFTMEVSVTDPLGATAGQTFALTVENSNDAPIVNRPLTSQDATQDQFFSFQIPGDTFSDIDRGDQLTYSATLVNGAALPLWLAFDAATGILSGNPGNDQVGTVDVSITATDKSGATANSLFSLNIANVNDAPELITLLQDQDAKQGQAFSYQIAPDTFRDIDAGDSLALSATLADGSPLPAWLVFDATTSTFSGMPDSASIGSIALNLTATDQAGASVADSFNLTVTGGNNAPIATADTATLTEDSCPPVVSGNVLANDVDPDAGDKLTVANPGFEQGDYGYLGLAADGKFGYILKNQSSDVQSLGRAAQVVDHFGYTVTDGTLSAASSLDITIKGTNDAPIIAKHLADQSVKNSKAFSFAMPTDSFIDTDKGDSLSYTATTADGKALPSWLKFDTKTGTFSGTAPKSAGYLDIRVTAIDKVAATGSTEGSLSASDVFQLSFGKSNKDSSSCYEYEDDYKRNNNFDWSKKPGETDSYYDNNRDNRFTNAHDDDRLKNKSADSPSHFLDSKQVDDYLREFDNDNSRSTWCDNDIARRWLMVSRALAYDLAELGDEQGRNHRLGADTGMFGRDIAGTLGSTHAFGMDTTLAFGNCGTDLKGFKGLQEGMKRM